MSPVSTAKYGPYLPHQRLKTDQLYLKVSVEQPKLAGPTDYLANYDFTPPTYFYHKMAGFIYLPHSAHYVFKVRNSHGSQLMMDGQQYVLDEDLDEVEDHEFTRYLEKGYHQIILRHWVDNHRKYREVSLQWKTPKHINKNTFRLSISPILR